MYLLTDTTITSRLNYHIRLNCHIYTCVLLNSLDYSVPTLHSYSCNVSQGIVYIRVKKRIVAEFE